MKNQSPLLLETLLALPPADRKFLMECTHNSAFFPQEDAQRLIQWLLPQLQAIREAFPSSESIHGELFPGQPFAEHRVRNTMALASSGLRRFLAWQHLEQQETQLDLFALARLRELGAEKPFLTLLHRLDKLAEQGETGFTDSAWLQFRLADEANGFFGQKQLRVQDQHLQQKVNALDHWYLSIKLKEACELRNRRRVLNQPFQLAFLTAMDPELDQPPFAGQNLLQLYRLVLRCLEHDRAEEVELLLEKMEEARGGLSKEEAHGLLKHAQNACIRQINLGRPAFLQALFRLYQQQWPIDSPLPLASLSHTEAKNIATVALRLKAFEWCESFLTVYKATIAPEFRENVYEFCMASLLIERGEVKQAIRKLQTIDFTDVYYALSARHLLLKCWWLLEDWEALDYAVQAFEGFLRRNKLISRETQSAHVHFLRVMKKMVVWRDRQAFESESVQEKRRQTLTTLIETLQPLAHRDWLRGLL